MEMDECRQGHDLHELDDWTAGQRGPSIRGPRPLHCSDRKCRHEVGRLRMSWACALHLRNIVNMDF